MARIAVIGAAGYVGLALCSTLKEAGHEVLAVARANGAFLLDRLGLAPHSPEQAARLGEVDAVVNLAYPKSLAGFDYPAGNREILTTIRAIARENARVVHASSLAVFGYALEHPQHAGPVVRRRDYFYIEGKIELERLLLGALPGRELHILRLGNVWGPASPTWTAALADRVLFGEAVGVRGHDGYSNATDVANAASYLAHLALGGQRRGKHFHHLAELGELPWSFWLKRIAGVLGVPVVYADQSPAYPQALWSELSSLGLRHSSFAMARDLLRGRFLTSWAGSALRCLPAALVERLERSAHMASAHAPAAGADPAFLAVMSAQRRFTSRLDPDWQPPLDAEASWARVLAWMEHAGYCG